MSFRFTPAKYPQSPSVELPNSDAHRCLLMTSTSRVSLKLMAMSKPFGMTVQVLGSSAFETAAYGKANNAPVKLGGVNNGYSI